MTLVFPTLIFIPYSLHFLSNLSNIFCTFSLLSSISTISSANRTQQIFLPPMLLPSFSRNSFPISSSLTSHSCSIISLFLFSFELYRSSIYSFHLFATSFSSVIVSPFLSSISHFLPTLHFLSHVVCFTLSYFKSVLPFFSNSSISLHSSSNHFSLAFQFPSSIHYLSSDTFSFFLHQFYFCTS